MLIMMLMALSEKAADQSDPLDKITVIQELSQNLTEANATLKELEEVFSKAQTQLIEKQSSVIKKFKQTK